MEIDKKVAAIVAGTCITIAGLYFGDDRVTIAGVGIVIGASGVKLYGLR